MKKENQKETLLMIISIVVTIMVTTLLILLGLQIKLNTYEKKVKELKTEIESLEEERSIIQEYVFGLTQTKDMLEMEKGLCDYYLVFEITYSGNTFFRGKSSNTMTVQVTQDVYENVSFDDDLRNVNEYISLHENISGWNIELITKFTR
jgi:hypothetical protein